MKVWNLGVPPGRPKNQVHGYEHTHLYSSNKRRRRRKKMKIKKLEETLTEQNSPLKARALANTNGSAIEIPM